MKWILFDKERNLHEAFLKIYHKETSIIMYVLEHRIMGLPCYRGYLCADVITLEHPKLRISPAIARDDAIILYEKYLRICYQRPKDF